MTTRWQKTFSQSSRQSAFTATNQLSFSEANEMIDRYIHFYNHERIQLKDWSGAAGADASPLKTSCFPT